MNRLTVFWRRLLKEPPFRLFTKAAIKYLPVSIRTKALWDVVSRPHYLVGVLAAADQAIQEGANAISVFEVGVAGGNGLLALGEVAAAVEAETKVRIAVYGLDAGKGLPEFIGDYRDYPDSWQPGDFPMDEEALRGRLRPNTKLIIGRIAETIPEHMPTIAEPIGFVAVDVDLYSSTRDLLQMFLLPGRRMLKHVPLYFDDIDMFFMHRFAGEMLAIDEFNACNSRVKTDRWRSIGKFRPFPESGWLRRMYVAHDLEAISARRPSRPIRVIDIDDTMGNTG